MPRSSLKNVLKLIEQKDIPVEQSFLSDLKRSIEKTAEADFRKPSQTYKPSSMKCIRNMYYQRIGAEPDRDSASYCSVGICNSGSDIHIRIQQAICDMKNNGIDCEYIDVADFIKSREIDDVDVVSKCGMETKLFHKGLNMSFMCDGIIRYNSHYYIVEFKTEASFKWTKREYVDSAHYQQGTAYSVALRLPEVLFIYINRDILDMKAYLFVPDDTVKTELVNTIMACEDYVKSNTVPPKPDNIAKKTCEYCSYKTICKGELD